MNRPSGPNFFIVGAPKAGTTALSEYLGDHPAILVSNPKEPFFFCPEFTGLPGPKHLEEYLDLFSAAGEDTQAIGEASAMYLYSKEAAARIAAFRPHAKILIMLRNPVEIAYSFHSQLLHASSETEPDFARAWALQEDRAAGRHLPPHVREASFLQYHKVACLGEQVDRYLQIFPREQIRFILFDRFVRETQAVYRETLEFLGVADDGRTEFPPANRNKVNRNQRLALLLNRPPPWASALVRKAKRALGLQNRGLLTPLRRLNVTVEARRPLPVGLRKRMVQGFSDDIERLSELTKLELDHWMA